MPLEDISVKVVHAPPPAGTTPNVRALQSEIATHLEALLQRGETNTIDLRSLPLLPGEREALCAALGRGEISARFDALGEAEIYETGFPGVWWTTLRAESGEVVAELIDIALQPPLLASHPVDVADGLARLRQDLADDENPPETAREDA
ncbi:hypothetical protein BJI67_05310 [Acidihalobacter aeolianus]|uniref:HupH hydrogenase expression protein C-terminal domain-containing protein n=1 Tax=Acidihalobacter aeolianus TaxID=2792603 RepID=A0A1D8K6J2_9GAMM|nr:hydrogenase expression/formation C-terminal domain-containing protein [Acidihalobacter aeolianus]AOV16564.1 hypothetical protein BJI67_05310 [Acidihalobacter aeolianus]